MSRCEHGQAIKLFCLSDNCNWREAGGCQNCLKKYHTHVENLDTINLQKLEQFTTVFNVNSDIKAKTKFLQEAVCNYFIIMKSQINTSLDAVSRSIINKLNYPYLSSEGHLTTYKKINNKQFKKLTKKQLKNFCNFAQTQNKEIVQLNEKKLYYEQVLELKQIFKNINNSFLTYSKAVQKIDNAFNVQKSFFNKVLEIISVIEHIQLKQQQQKKQKQKSNNKSKILNNYQNSTTNTSKKSSTNDRNRKISIDIGAGIDLNKFVTVPVNQNFDQNERQIYEKKKKLFQMLNNPHQAQKSPQIKKINQQKSNQLVQNNMTSVENTKESKQIPQQHKHMHLPEQRQIPSNNFALPESIPVKIKQQQKNAKLGIFEDLLSKGINLPQLIAHTILPRQASRQKLYQDTKDVKQRKITIPVKVFRQHQQNQSPLLKRKRQKNKEEKQQGLALQQINQDGMKKLSLFGTSDQNKSNQPTVNQQNASSRKQYQKMLLKDKEADSLALLLQSLPLSAQKAIPILEAALKFAYNNLSAAEYLSYLYLEIQKPKQCLQLCNKFLQQLQDSPQANQLAIHLYNNKAAALNMLGRYSESINLLQKCLAQTKKDIYYKNLADAYFSIAIYEKASMNYQNALKMNSNMDQAYYNLAVCYYLQDHLHEAQFNITKALRINPKNQDYLKLGRQIMIKLQI